MGSGSSLRRDVGTVLLFFESGLVLLSFDSGVAAEALSTPANGFAAGVLVITDVCGKAKEQVVMVSPECFGGIRQGGAEFCWAKSKRGKLKK